MNVIVVADADYDRADVFLAEKLDSSRNRIQKLIAAGRVKTETGLVEKSSQKVQAGQKFSVDIPKFLNLEYLKPEPVDFEVVYEDEYLLIVNKPSGLVVHPAPGNWRGTLVNGLIYRYPELRTLTDWLRPGIVHRLDMGTSGLMIVAKTQKMMLAFQSMFLKRTIHKNYIALVQGCPKKREGTLSGPINHDPNNYLKMAIIEGGKPSLTGYKVLWNMNGVSLVECRLFTGRTHQIRVHMSALGCPLVGDVLYGANDEGLERVFLHSWKLEFEHPAKGRAMKFRQPLTKDFIEQIQEKKNSWHS